MHLIFYILAKVVFVLISALQLFLFVRMIISWIMPLESNALVNFVFFVTEPVLKPVRLIIDKIPALRDLPIDLSFLITYLLLSVIGGFFG